MKTKSKRLFAGGLMMVCLQFAFASHSPTDVKNAEPANKAPEAAVSDSEAPLKCDRASSLIGMKILDPKDEYLGKVKDIVFDRKNERIAYVVMAVNIMGLKSFQEKLLAVPMNALTASKDSNHLILSSEREKIEVASGIDPQHWPSANSPAWGAQPFWQKDGTDSDKTDKSTQDKATDDKKVPNNDYTPKSNNTPDQP